MIDASLRIANTDNDIVQPLRAQPRAETAPPAAPGQDVRVTLSAEARAAEQNARIAGPDQGAATQGAADPASASPVQPSAAATRSDAAAGAVSIPATQGESGMAAGLAPARDDLAANLQAPREPDAPTSEGNQAVQLYLENAVRPDNRPAPSALRDSA